MELGKDSSYGAAVSVTCLLAWNCTSVVGLGAGLSCGPCGPVPWICSFVSYVAYVIVLFELLPVRPQSGSTECSGSTASLVAWVSLLALRLIPVRPQFGWRSFRRSGSIVSLACGIYNVSWVAYLSVRDLVGVLSAVLDLWLR